MSSVFLSELGIQQANPLQPIELKVVKPMCPHPPKRVGLVQHFCQNDSKNDQGFHMIHENPSFFFGFGYSVSWVRSNSPTNHPISKPLRPLRGFFPLSPTRQILSEIYHNSQSGNKNIILLSMSSVVVFFFSLHIQSCGMRQNYGLLRSHT